MTLAVVTRPTEALLTAAQARDRLGLGPGASDERIDMLVAAATAVLDGPEGWLGRALREWTLELRLPRFPIGDDSIELRYPPFIALKEIAYTDISGAPQTLDLSLCVIDGGLIDEGVLSPAYGHTWPTVRSGPAAVRIRYSCGFEGGEGIFGAVPAPILQAILLQVAATNALLRKDPGLSAETVPGVLSRSWATTDIGDIYDQAAMRLLAPYRVFA